MTCTSKRYTSDYIPSAAGYTEYGSSLGPFVAVATSGGVISAPLSGTSQDPYYPGSGTAAGTDVCSGHADPQGNFHYHIMPTCLAQADPSLGNPSTVACTANTECTSDLKSFAISNYDSTDGLQAIAISRDGHVVYGPYSASGS